MVRAVIARREPEAADEAILIQVLIFRMIIKNSGVVTVKPGILKVLSDDEIARIDAESHRILREAGVRVLHEEALDLLECCGCRVDRSSCRVRIPSEVVQKALEKTPKNFTLFGRDPSYSIPLGGDEVCFGPGGFAVFVEDLRSGARRRALRSDLREHLRLSDALPGCQFNHVNVFPSDLPDKTADLHIWADALVYQTKPVMSENYNARSVDLLVEMASMVRGTRKSVISEPLICLDVCVLSPLSHDTRQVELLLAGARYGLPISINSGPIAGGTSPVTLAAVVSQANAEILSAIVIAYAATPGTPVLYGSWGRHMDMRFGTVTMGGPEFALLKICTAQMGRYYAVPTRGGGVLTDSLVSDAQAGYEKMLTALVPALAGLNYVSGMGLNETENLQSLAQLVIDNEIVLMVKRVLEGVAVDPDHLATDLIIKTGPGGNYLADDHTLRFFREELFDPEISNRMPHERWSMQGGPSARERGAQKAVMILQQHHPEDDLDPKVVREIYRLLQAEDERQTR